MNREEEMRNEERKIFARYIIKQIHKKLKRLCFYSGPYFFSNPLLVSPLSPQLKKRSYLRFPEFNLSNPRWKYFTTLN